jgi:hypothetical protein
MMGLISGTLHFWEIQYELLLHYFLYVYIQIKYFVFLNFAIFRPALKVGGAGPKVIGPTGACGQDTASSLLHPRTQHPPFLHPTPPPFFNFFFFFSFPWQKKI